MTGRLGDYVENLLYRRVLSRLRASVRAAPDAELSELRKQRRRARQLRSPLQELIHIGNDRLSLPRIGSTTFTRPAGTDWSWRPQGWRASLPLRGLAPAQTKAMLGSEVTLFHDCPVGEMSLRQDRNKRERDLAPYGITLEVFGFQGSYLSLVVDLPQAACTGLRRHHLFRLSTLVEAERPVKMLARLNIKHGPNTDQNLQVVPLEAQDAFVEFDLAHGQINESRVERIWVDLIFENPRMNRITLHDLTFCRYPRAAL